MNPSERDAALARLRALKHSVDDEQQRERSEHARVNKALSLNMPPRALSVVGATAMFLIGAVVFALVALGTKNAWFLLPSGALALFAVGGLIASTRHSQE